MSNVLDRRKTAIILVEVPKPITQYGETDWQFLKRFDSHLHIPVYADCEADDRVLHFGMEKGVHIDAEMGLCHSRISRKYYETDSKKDNVTRKDYLYYKVGSDENGRIGDVLNCTVSRCNLLTIRAGVETGIFPT